MGLKSLNGVSLGPVTNYAPKTIRGSISRVAPSKTTE